MKILDNEGELIVNLTDVKDEQHLQSLLDQEDTELTEVMYDTPFFAMSLKDWEKDYGMFETVQDERVCTYEEWMSEVREWAKDAIACCE